MLFSRYPHLQGMHFVGERGELAQGHNLGAESGFDECCPHSVPGLPRSYLAVRGSTVQMRKQAQRAYITCHPKSQVGELRFIPKPVSPVFPVNPSSVTRSI